MAGTIFLACLDIGTTKISTMVAEARHDSLEIIAVSTVTSAGVRKGVIVDIESTLGAIKESVRRATEISGVEIKEVYVGISDSHIKTTKSTGAVVLPNGAVTAHDIDEVMENAQTIYVPLDKEILHVIPLNYNVDGETEIYNPQGMKGTCFEANVQIVTAATNSIHNLLKCCEMAGLTVAELVHTPIVSSMAVLRDDELELGVFLIDIGGGTTDIAFFKNNRFQGATVLDIAGNQFTNDLAVGLSVSPPEAEKIKKAYGMPAFPEDYEDESILIGVSGRSEKKVAKSFITKIIMDRSEELIGMISDEMRKLAGSGALHQRVVITGGVSQMKGFEAHVQSLLNMPVRIGVPEGKDVIEKVQNPIFSTLMGLLYYGHKSTFEISVNGLTGDCRGMKRWFKGLVGKFFRIN
ncbi:cell division protein FtsA [Candidatus Magnetomonas plexicatena]|uniref:cell division protein FtsA n=1 Tax=Candidatus Magnetomonas plexicatena TaxID=2552947 RepID=UPI001C781A30|nr:cell division protein FtsA [Nitrospirales bacterium LBB_01]